NAFLFATFAASSGRTAPRSGSTLWSALAWQRFGRRRLCRRHLAPKEPDVYGPLSKMKGIQMKTLLCSYVLTLLLTPVFAQQKTPPPPGPARPLNLPRITEKKLSNGLTVVLAPMANVPKVTAILTFRAAGTAA